MCFTYHTEDSGEGKIIEKVPTSPNPHAPASPKQTYLNVLSYTGAGTGMSSGVNFAIPIDTVLRTVPYLIVYGTPYADRY